MNIANLLQQSHILLGLKSGSKREFLQDLSQRVSNICSIDQLTLFDNLMERENLGSTGFGNGVAIPHGRFCELDHPMAFFARPNYAVDFDAIDGKPVDLVFLLISPENSGADHLTALALLSRCLKNDNVCEQLRNMSNPTEIYALLCEL